MQIHFSYIKDSQHFIQIALNNKFNNLKTGDFESLYLNIHLNEAIIIISDMIISFNSYDFTSYGFHSLLNPTTSIILQKLMRNKVHNSSLFNSQINQKLCSSKKAFIYRTRPNQASQMVPPICSLDRRRLVKSYFQRRIQF
jgi:hypothetical protein